MEMIYYVTIFTWLFYRLKK